MEPINTLFNGNYYRSRLEAKWAVFFDYARIKYLYEQEGFKSDEGECYLPDFYLPDVYLRKSKGVYVEIKPGFYEAADIPASKWFTDNLVLFRDLPIKNIWGNWHEEGGYQLCIRGEGWWDLNMYLWICEGCGTAKIDFADENNDCCPKCSYDINAYGNKCDIERLKRAAKVASMQRFEHLL
jgi:hypothetical protein